MAPRAQWKGFLKIDELTCPVALYTAASEAERVAFHTINRSSGNRIRRIFVDNVTEKPVEKDDQVKGYEVDKDQYVIFEPEEITAVMPVSDKTIKVDAFITCGDIDTLYFDKPYYLAPSGPGAEEAFYLIRDGMQGDSVAAIAQAVLFRRMRTLLIRAHGPGMIATMLNYQYEVRSAKEAFEEIPDVKVTAEMLDLAKHILKTKSGEFDAAAFDDRYEDALADLVRAKMEGRALPKRKPVTPTKVVDLMAALRQSAGVETSDGPAKRSRSSRTPQAKSKTRTKAKPKAKSSQKAAQPRRRAG